MKRNALFGIFVILAAVSTAGQSAPPSAGELAYRTVSPVFLGGGMHVTRISTPQGTLLNPASAAGFQRVILDVNYSNLQALGTDADGMGHAVNVALAIPTKVGVVTTGFGFLDTSDYEGTSMDLGTSGRAGVSFSKEIYSDVWFGAGIVGELGNLDGDLQGGGALNIGFLHFPETFGGLKNFRWGASLTGLGYRFGSSSRGYLNSIPGNITPALGIAFDITDSEEFTWTFRGDVRAPSISDFWAGVASDLYFGDVARLSVSSSLDMRDAFDGSWRTIIPSAAIGLHFPLGGSKESGGDDQIRTTEIDIQAAAAPLYDGVWAFSGGVTLPFGVRDENPPSIDVTYEPPQYISPNYDGIQDELLVPYGVEDERFVTAYEWRIVDDSGSVVRTYVNKDERPENETVKNLWSRLISPMAGTTLPEAFRWDGVTDAGSMAPDGEYDVYMEFRDDNDNAATAGPFAVVVDTAAPDLELGSPEGLDLIFSPDGDGLKDSFRIEQSGSGEHLWEAAFADASGAVVREWTWTAAEPDSFDWDGTGTLGEVVPDGVYGYRVASTDLAGNSTEASVEGIIIDTRQPEVGLAIDKAVFSPGTDSPVSTVNIEALVPVKAGIVDWSLDVVDSSGEPVRSWSRRGGAALPETVAFDGRDDSGRIVPEGRYTGRFRLEYGNGFHPEVTSPPFQVDVTPPSATVGVDFALFSPQGDSRRSIVTFDQSSSREDTWTGILRDAEGREVKSWVWISTADPNLRWDGRDAAGRLVPDGTYSYVLESTDRAGNWGRSAPVSVTVDTSTVEATLTVSHDVFGPTGNGVNDELTLYMVARSDSPISDWTLVVNNASGDEIRSWEGAGLPPDSVSWNGRAADRSAVPDGRYSAELTVRYEKGDVAAASAGPVTVDTRPPEIELSVRDGLFSPDGDGRKDSLSVVQSSSREVSFAAKIADSSDRTVRTWVWTGQLESFAWDGRDDSGNALPDGDYSYEVSGVDAAGNETRRSVRGIRIDTAPVPVYLTAAQGYIKAGEEDPERMQSFAAVVPNDEGLESWVFRIVGEDGRAALTRSGDGPVPDGFAWNGTDGNGRPVEGVFKGVLEVAYLKGARPQAESRSFVSDGSPPEVTVDVSPRPFSPDGDNVDDEAVISLTVEDRSRISEWSLAISDPRGREFITFSGRGRPSERIIWDGRSGRGESVESAEDYPYVLTVTDALGQTSVKEGEIAVDVLVIREGDRLKIQINNITFQPNSPQLTATGPEGEKNRQVLDRLAEIMKKYGSYRIVVEGHAVSLNWADPAAAAREQRDILIPLSQSRAQTVVDELRARGIGANRMTAQGIGGEKPIVPHGDLEERWRNRRVEFYLEK